MRKNRTSKYKISHDKVPLDLSGEIILHRFWKRNYSESILLQKVELWVFFWYPKLENSISYKPQQLSLLFCFLNQINTKTSK